MDSVLGYSLSRCELLGHFGPDMSFGKTSGELFPLTEDEILSQCCGSLPRAGMMRNGAVYGHPILDINTDVSGCSLWPTPRVITGGAESATRKQELGRTVSGGGDLQDVAQNWPTAGANDWRGTARPGQRRGQLDEAAEQLWATPRVSVIDGYAVPSATHGWDLPAQTQDHAARLDPATSTPGAPSSPPAPGSRRRLNPVFVEWLMGFPLFWTWLPKVAKSRTSKKRFQALMEKSKSSST